MKHNRMDPVKGVLIMEGNRDCSCTYPGCPRHGNCKACVAYHSRMGQFTACFFSKEAEKTWDRSFGKLVEDRKKG